MKMKIIGISLLLLAAVTGCSAKGNEGGQSTAPSPIDASEALAENPYNIINNIPKSQYDIQIKDTKSTLQSGTETLTKGYLTDADYPGGMIIVDKNTDLTFNITNSLEEKTSIHWHGLKVPNDQDGPGSVLNAGERASFEYSLADGGTYWYHPHERPILPQLNTGLYAPFIVKEEFDSQYAGDYVLMLDDWTLSPKGKLNEKYSIGDMEVLGNVETVNGKSGSDIHPVTLKKGEIVKLRFLNASTAQVHTIELEDHEMTVTHLDGLRLVEPYTATSIRLNPGERADVEIKGIQEEGTYYITNERNFGIRIPVVYEGIGQEMDSPFVPGTSRAFEHADSMPVDLEFVLNSKMESGFEHGSHMAEMDMDKIQWTINDKSYPDQDMINLEAGKVYKMRFYNRDTEMMHAMAHPIHIHGEHFQVVSINGEKPAVEIFKDTMEVKPDEYVDIAIKFDNPGMWMLHCHIIDHEDKGMLTVLNVQ